MAFNPKLLNPEQQKDYAALKRNTGGNFTNIGGDQGLMKRYGQPLNSHGPGSGAPPTAPVPRMVSSHGPGSGAPDFLPRPVPAPRMVNSHGPGSGAPDFLPHPLPKMVTPPGPPNLPPGGITPPGPGNLPKATPKPLPRFGGDPRYDDLIGTLMSRFRY